MTNQRFVNDQTCRKFRQVRMEGNRQVTRELPFYNLDMIISLGYRVKSLIATQFRRWATERLKEYMIKGFTMDDERLKNLGGGNYWRDQKNRPASQLLKRLGGRPLEKVPAGG